MHLRITKEEYTFADMPMGDFVFLSLCRPLSLPLEAPLDIYVSHESRGIVMYDSLQVEEGGWGVRSLYPFEERPSAQFPNHTREERFAFDGAAKSPRIKIAKGQNTILDMRLSDFVFDTLCGPLGFPLQLPLDIWVTDREQTTTVSDKIATGRSTTRTSLKSSRHLPLRISSANPTLKERLMSASRRIILIVYLLTVAFTCIWTPWRGQFFGQKYGWIWRVPVPSAYSYGAKIEYGSLIAELTAISAFFGAIYLLAPTFSSSKPEQKPDQKEHRTDTDEDIPF